MTIKIKELISNQQHLVDLTDTESSEINGGYAALLTAQSGAIKAAQAARIVSGKSAFDLSLVAKQQAIGITIGQIAAGTGFAITLGRGRYTPLAVAAQLDG
jgi:hypothetical protein